MTPHPIHAERIRKMKQRLAVRAWEYRQRHTSKGVWDRVQGLLALSERAMGIDDALARELASAGHVPHPAGLALEPPRRIFVLAHEDAGRVERGVAIPIRLDADLLSHPQIALVLFPAIAPPRG